MGSIWWRNDIEVTEPTELIEAYRSNIPSGWAYYNSRCRNGANQIEFGDLALVVLLAGRPDYSSALVLHQAIQDGNVNISAVTTTPLQQLTDDEVTNITQLYCTLKEQWNKWGYSRLTKLTHPIRRSTVPVTDTRTIFRKFCKCNWKPGGNPIAGMVPFHDAIKQVRDVLKDDNSDWTGLESQFPDLTRVELFDMGWYMIAENFGLIQQYVTVHP